MRAILTEKAPRPAGHYSQGVVHNGIVYVAGQLPIDPGSSRVIEGDIDTQTERTLRNVEAILDAAGSGLDRVLSLTIYVTDYSLWGGVNAAVARVLGEHRPARAVVPVPSLRAGCLVEIQAVASTGRLDSASPVEAE